MNKKIFLFIFLSFFLYSCFGDEKPSGNFLDGTIWRCMETGSVYNENDEFQYAYQETHLLSFAGNTFTLVTDGKYDYNNDGIYEEEESVNQKGAYRFEYPKSTLTFENGTLRTVTVTSGGLTLESENTNEKSYIFTPKK